MKKVLCVWLSMLILLISLSACKAEQEEEPSGPVTLNVVTENIEGPYGWDERKFTGALYTVIGNFRVNHPDVMVNVEILPTDKNERKIRLQKLRTELMAGDGPDVFLLPSGSINDTEKDELREPLFSDVEMAMKNLYFADLSEYYDTDEELKKEELQQDVMNAGVLDGARYVLPMGFNMPVICYNPVNLEQEGLTEEDLHAPLGDFLSSALESGNMRTQRSAIAHPYSILSLFQPLFDYETEQLLLDRETVETVCRLRKQLSAASEDLPLLQGFTTKLDFYLTGFNFVFEKTDSYFVGTLYHAPELLGLGQVTGVDVKVTPLRSVGGEVAAEVTYFGAANANCEHPKEAYEFLRTFLSAEVQHQTGIGAEPTRLEESDNAWPVRVVGSVQTKWDAKKYGQRVGEDKKRREAVTAVQLSDEDMPFLFEKIDLVQFRLPVAEKEVWLNRADAADWIIEQLQYHIAEG